MAPCRRVSAGGPPPRFQNGWMQSPRDCWPAKRGLAASDQEASRCRLGAFGWERQPQEHRGEAR